MNTLAYIISIIIISHAVLDMDYTNPASQTLTFSQGSAGLGSTDTVTYSVLGDGALKDRMTSLLALQERLSVAS